MPQKIEIPNCPMTPAQVWDLGLALAAQQDDTDTDIENFPIYCPVCDNRVTNCHEHEGGFDCSPFCQTCEGNQVFCKTCERN